MDYVSNEKIDLRASRYRGVLKEIAAADPAGRSVDSIKLAYHAGRPDVVAAVYEACAARDAEAEGKAEEYRRRLEEIRRARS